MKYKGILFLSLIAISFSHYCHFGDFTQINQNTMNSYEAGPGTETCFLYHFDKEISHKIGLIFAYNPILTTEVVIYKYKENITFSYDEYSNYYDKYIISENRYKDPDPARIFGPDDDRGEDQRSRHRQ